MSLDTVSGLAGSPLSRVRCLCCAVSLAPICPIGPDCPTSKRSAPGHNESRFCFMFLLLLPTRCRWCCCCCCCCTLLHSLLPLLYSPSLSLSLPRTRCKSLAATPAVKIMTPPPSDAPNLLSAIAQKVLNLQRRR